MSEGLKAVADKILVLTNKGLDIIQEIYPQATPKKNFKIREDDQNASCSVYDKVGGNEQDRYRINDFAGDVKTQDCFGLWAMENNCDYWEAIVEIAKKIQAEKGEVLLNSKTEIYKYDYTDWPIAESPVELNEDGFFYVVREIEELDFKILGPEISFKNPEGVIGKRTLVTKEVTEYFNFTAIKEFYTLSKDKRKVQRYRENETFPIYAFINKNKKGKEWLKVYMPKGKKSLQKDQKDFRFRHLGYKESNFIYGLDQIREVYQDGKEKALEDYQQNLIDKTAEKQGRLSKAERSKLLAEAEFKIERISILSGGTDGFCMRGLGEFVVFKNSETDTLSKELMDELFEMAEEVVNVPDTDNTGRKKGTEFALEYLQMKTLWLDDYYPSGNVKDFKNAVTVMRGLSYSKVVKKVKNMLEAAKPAQFWEVYTNEKTGKLSFGFHHIFGFYFLKLNGFCRVDDESRKDGFYFARLHNHVVEELRSTQPIKDFFKNFLLERQKEIGIRAIPYDLINSLISSPRMSDGNLASLHNRTLDFADYDQNSQFFFFSDKIWRVTKDGTDEVSSFKNYVLKSQLIDELIFQETEHKLNVRNLKIHENQFRVDSSGSKILDEYKNPIPEKKPYFTIKSLGVDTYDIEIHEKHCDFLNYQIQTSRMFWEDEKRQYADRSYNENAFYERSRFDIAGEWLTEEQQMEQKAHLINKIFTIGYMLHRFKDRSRPWIPFAVDNAVTEDKAAEGGSGKGLFFSAFNYMLNQHIVNGKDDIENDRFWLENVTEHTDLIFIDDVKRGFSLEFVYQISTGNLAVNTKFQTKSNIKYKDSGKIAVASNYSIRDMNGSSLRRRLLLAFSDYYHSKNEKRSEHTPIHDFGYQLFSGWDDHQWSMFVNFMCQCLSFYLSCSNKIEAPDGNVLKRTWLAEMGEQFEPWANDYFADKTDEYLVKSYVERDFKKYAEKNNFKFAASLTPNSFKKKLDAWCKYYEYDLEDRKNINILPIDEYGKPELSVDGKHKKRSMEHIKITKHEDEAQKLQRELDELSNNEDPYQ
ncbi:MAG: hypothetical protein J6O88_05985 [Chryseobacterium sp.]|uniref:hypothetical protein n=1 Tax=Chryseobacterium sp. TaxID=1871047 RepID=UPI001B0AA758|nr:hypothetical protein [Chryseobacterium sp.]MBO6184233.1 hypothetical protein [Chryseobacterium sp.]